jgi:hypothetical protein
MLSAAVLAIVIGTASVNAAQSSDARAVEQAQRAVRTQITGAEGNVAVRFGDGARTEPSTNATRRVHGSGTAVRDRDGKSRPFAYDALVDARKNWVSDVHHYWDGDWRLEAINHLTGIKAPSSPSGVTTCSIRRTSAQRATALLCDARVCRSLG